MSGSSGGGSGNEHGGGKTTRDEFDCLKYVERVHVNSPDPAVVATVKKDDVLSVSLYKKGVVSVIHAVTKGGKIVGSLVPRNMASLLNCIEQGVVYCAVVIEIKGGLVKVEIRPR